MELVGKKVKHTRFGVGVIVAQSESYLSVQFTSKSEIVKFVYPLCFKTFLSLLDTATS